MINCAADTRGHPFSQFLQKKKGGGGGIESLCILTRPGGCTSSEGNQAGTTLAEWSWAGGGEERLVHLLLKTDKTLMVPLRDAESWT